MKRFVAIALLTIHFFNLGGYMLLHLYAVNKSDQFMNELISKSLYNPNTLIQLKIKQNLPGITEWNDFKNVTGHIQLKNVAYNYVKLKFTKDTLYVMCVPNYAKTRLIENNVIYAKQVNDIPQDEKSEHSSVKKGGADNTYSHPEVAFNFLSFEEEHPLVTKPHYISITPPYLSVPGQPPELLS
jgi:hypothetical protein